MATLDAGFSVKKDATRENEGAKVVKEELVTDNEQHLAPQQRDAEIITSDSHLKKLSWLDDHTRGTESVVCNNGETEELLMSPVSLKKGCIVKERESLDHTPLVQAALDGDVGSIQELLQDPNVNLVAAAKGGYTALHAASFKGSHKIVRQLLFSSNDVPQSANRIAQILELLGIRTDLEGFTALHMAACSTNEKVVQVFGEFFKVALLSRDSLEQTVNARDCVERTPLYYAAWNDNEKVASELLSCSSKLDVNASDRDGFTALHVSAWRGREDLVTLLLEHLGDEGIPDVQPNTPANRNKRTLERVCSLQKEGDLEDLPRPSLTKLTIEEERNNVTPLHYAVKKGKEAIVTLLLGNSSIDVHVENSEHETVFDMALADRNGKILWELLPSFRESHDGWEMIRNQLSMRGYKKFKPNTQSAQDKKLNNCGELLKLAMEKSKLEDILFLLKELEKELAKMNDEISEQVKGDVSLLHHAAFAGLAKLVQIVIEIPSSDINETDSELRTPLHYAAGMGHASVVSVFLNNSKCRVNAEDKFGRTALQVAVESERHDVEKLLMDRPDVRDYVDRFYMNREVFVDAANTMLLAAALIAGVTFAGWLQPPGGFTPYPDLEVPGAPGQYESYASVDQHISMRVFWVFNSLSFFCSVATMIAGAGAVLPTLDVFIAKEVKYVKRTLVATSTLLVFAVVFILVAFAAAGYASLPPIFKYERSMTYTVIFGVFICMMSMLWFLKRLYGIRPSWWRRCEGSVGARLWSKAAHQSKRPLFSKPRPNFHYSIPR